jgi:hypothetical protein
MSTYLFFPTPTYSQKLRIENSISLRELCLAAGISCKASGKWTKRRIALRYAEKLRIIAEPGDWGAVLLYLPNKNLKEKKLARIALQIMAYGLHDIAAKESIAGKKWTIPKPPSGRPRKPLTLSNAERQRRYRERKK